MIKTKDRESALIAHARAELAILLDEAKKEDEESYKMQKVLNDGIMDVIKVFDMQEHSGFTAQYAIKIIDRLLKFQPLTELTLDKDEWCQVSDRVWQNTRASNVFIDLDRYKGEPYCLDGPRGKSVTLKKYPYAYWGIYKKKKD